MLALERRFQKVLVEEPSVEDTIAILRGLKERYELHHNVVITDPAIVAAASLSHRYISDRQLPDKAIDLIDEAASSIRLQMDSKPEDLDRLERRLIQLKLEQKALEKDADDASKKNVWQIFQNKLMIGSRNMMSLMSCGQRRKRHCMALKRLKKNWNKRALNWKRLNELVTSTECLNCNMESYPNLKSNLI